MNRYDKARTQAIFGIEKALIAHGNQDFFSIDDELEQYEHLISELDLAPNTLLVLTLEFWSAWSDAAVHDWKHYEPVKENDWKLYAEILLKNLGNNTEVTHAEINEYFSVFPAKGIFTKLNGLFGNKKDQ